MIKTSRQFWKQLVKQHEILGKSESAQGLCRPHFTYAPLPPGTIRLLRPAPLSQPGGHVWDLQTVRLDEPDLKFNALSYTWGLRTKPIPITLNNQRFLVQQNLYSALPYLAVRCMRGTGESIWIDALCINQDDEEEKTDQIRLMSQIYQKAQSVWVWLGLVGKQETIPEAIRMLDQVGRKVPLDARVDTRGIAKESGAQLQTSFGLDAADPAVLSAMRYLLNNPWFDRVWIVQEAALARGIVFLCGQHEINARILENAVRGALAAARHHPKLVKDITIASPVNNALSVFDIREIVQGTQVGADELLLVVSIMMAIGNHQCLMPEDRIRGVAGISSHEHFLGLVVADRSRIPFLYTVFSRDLILRTYPFTRLWWTYVSLAFTFKRRIGLPSWVPDLHRQAPQYLCYPRRHLLNYTFDGHVSSPEYQASRCSDNVKGGKQWYELVMEGKFLDRVECVYEKNPGTLHKRPKLEAKWGRLFDLADWEERISDAIFCLDSSKRYDSPTSSLDNHPISIDTYVRTLAGGMTHNDFGPLTVDTYREYRIGVKELRQVIQGLDMLLRMSEGERVSDFELSDVGKWLARLRLGLTSPVASWNNALSRLGYLQLFLTERARLGFATREVRPGDVVCVLNGAYTPHILRQVRTSRGVMEKWRLVSDAYVHGLMDGEADAMQPGARDIILV
ncbi:heterokaryon incompatibility protein-domain-containing protein [Paraphoma chrysanthemicola]|nr:heterokaryon incompatibility protein-domain-containing protein [Paraphoma chrysanthemicola]